MKRFIIVLIFCLTCAFIVHMTLFDQIYNYQNISDALFVVGIFIFFLSLIAITEATKIFLIFSYGAKSVLKRKNFQYQSYYEYVKDKEKEKRTPYVTEAFIISVVFIVVSLILSYIVLNQ